MSKSNQFFLHAIINGNIRDSLIQGSVPWSRNFASKDQPMPYRADSGNPITGINALHLATIVAAKGYESNGWISWSKLKELGGNPVVDEKASAQILMYINISKNPKKPYWKPRYYKVFNLDQTENLPAEMYSYKESTGKQNFVSMVKPLIKRLGLKVKTGDNQTYNAKTDTLTVPAVKTFKNKGLYEAQVLKGLVLSTIHEDRLDREVEDNLFEQLVMELGAFFLMANHGSVRMTTNKDLVAKYTAKMDKDTSFFENATKVAMKAVRYILDDDIVSTKKEVIEDNTSISIAC